MFISYMRVCWAHRAYGCMSLRRPDYYYYYYYYCYYYYFILLLCRFQACSVRCGSPSPGGGITVVLVARCSVTRAVTCVPSCSITTTRKREYAQSATRILLEVRVMLYLPSLLAYTTLLLLL